MMSIHQESNLTQLLLASSIGGICATFLTLPFDVLKVRLQCHIENIQMRPHIFCHKYIQSLCLCVNTCSNYHLELKQGSRATTYSMFKIILSESGMKGFWKGLTPTLVQSIPQVTVYYTLYQKFKLYLAYQPVIPIVLIPALAGVASRTITSIIIAPLELIRTNLQSSPTVSFREIRSYFANSVRLNGISSLWRGLYPMLIRDVPFTAVYWPTFELLKSQILLTFTPGNNINIFANLVSGWLCGSLAAALTTPSDVVKTQIEISIQNPSKRDVNIFNIIRVIHAKYGLKGFFRGVTPRCAKIGPACAIMIATFEVIISLFKEYR